MEADKTTCTSIGRMQLLGIFKMRACLTTFMTDDLFYLATCISMPVIRVKLLNLQPWKSVIGNHHEYEAFEKNYCRNMAGKKPYCFYKGEKNRRRRAYCDVLPCYGKH